jgi:LacI family transcriptional regulator
MGDIDARLPEPALEWGAAMVSLQNDHSAEGIASVIVDDAAVGAAAAHHFAEMGLRAVGGFGFAGHDFFDQRLATFRSETAAAGIEYVSGLDRISRRRGEYGVQFRRWLAAAPRPVGMFVGCDAWAQLLTNACRTSGLRVPEDVAVLGVDNDLLHCELNQPPLSSVAIPWERMGIGAAELLEREMAAVAAGRSKAAATCEVIRIGPSTVVARRSSDMRAVDDPDVAAVLDFLRRHAAGPLTMADLYRAVPVARHRAERGFRRLLGRSITDELRRMRVESAKRLLESTNLSMPEVAIRSGFANASKLAIHFRRETGGTPTEYRRSFQSAIL